MRIAIKFCVALTGIMGWLVISAPANAQDAAAAFPPQIFIFDSYDEDLASLTVTLTVTRAMPVTVTRVNPAGVAETSTAFVPELRTQSHTHLIAETSISTVGGKQIDIKEGAQQLKKGQPVILVVKGRKLPDEYKSLFRDEAIILEVKALGTPPELDRVKEPRTK